MLVASMHFDILLNDLKESQYVDNIVICSIGDAKL